MKAFINTLLVVALALASTQSQAQLFGKKEPPKPVVLLPTTDRAQALTDLVTTGQALQRVPKPYEGANKEVAIASVVLEFVTDTGSSSTRGNVMNDRKTTQQVNYKLLNVSPETMQAIADEFYENLKVALAAQGYTVWEQEKLLANAKFAEHVKDAGGAKKSGGLLSKDEFTKVIAKGTADLSGVSGGFKKVGLLQSFKDGPLLLSVNLIINFAQFKDVGSSVFTGAGSEFAAVQSGVQLSVAPESNFDFSTASNSPLPFWMVKTTILPSQIAASVSKVSMSGGQMASLAFGLLAGKVVVNENYEVKAMDNYKELASGDLKMFAEVIAQGAKKQEPKQEPPKN